MKRYTVWPYYHFIRLPNAIWNRVKFFFLKLFLLASIRFTFRCCFHVYDRFCFVVEPSVSFGKQLFHFCFEHATYEWWEAGLKAKEGGGRGEEGFCEGDRARALLCMLYLQYLCLWSVQLVRWCCSFFICFVWVENTRKHFPFYM